MRRRTSAGLRRYPLSEPISFAVAPDLTLVGDAWGAPDAPPVLFLHGGGQTRHAWSGSCAVVAAHGWRAIALDQRGHGESGRAPHGDYEDADFAQDVVAVVRALGRPVVLVGASLGGLASLLASHAHPDIARAVVLVDVTPRLEQTGVLRVLSFMRARPEGFESLDEAAEAVAAYQPQRRRAPSTEGLRKNLRQGPDGRWRWHWDPELMASWSPERWSVERRERAISERFDAARALTVPTLLIHGKQSDVVSDATSREFLAVAPHARYVDLADAAHMVAGDRNDVFTETVVGFLRSLPGAPA